MIFLYCWLHDCLDWYPALDWYVRKKIEIDTEYYEQWVSDAGGAYLLLKKIIYFLSNACVSVYMSLMSLSFADTGQTFYTASTNTLLL